MHIYPPYILIMARKPPFVCWSNPESGQQRRPGRSLSRVTACLFVQQVLLAHSQNPCMFSFHTNTVLDILKIDLLINV